MNPQEHTDSPCVQILAIGGIDPGGGSGLARDIVTARALGARCLVVGTAWTVQDGARRHMVEARSPEGVRIGLRSVLDRAPRPDAVKIGMVADASIALALAEELASYGGPIVYDPVIRASSGGDLYQGDREAILRLAIRSTLVTPNLAEAAWLLGQPIRTEKDARAGAAALRALGIPAVLLKGGHLDRTATDVLTTSAGEWLFSADRVAGPSPRGTGCALATAIAVGLARKDPLDQALPQAVGGAKAWLTDAIANAETVGEEKHLPALIQPRWR